MECCDVCCEKINNSNRKRVNCPFCDLKYCRACAQKYLLSTIEDPHCMGCKHVHNRELVSSYCSSKFIHMDLKQHRENVLFEREKARMPETQPHVMRELEKRSLRTSYIYMYYLLTNIDRDCTLDYYVRPCLKETIREYMVYIYDQIQTLRNFDTTVENVYAFSQSCPDEECRGFLDDNWKCGICKNDFCKKCNEPVSFNHTCNKDIVKTLKLLKRDTKQCPKCNVPIYKIEGCAQMWCTQCHVAFDWKTRRIETGRIHNPHYFEFKKRGREHGDIPCGGRPAHRELLQMPASKNIQMISMAVIHLNYHLIYRHTFQHEDNLHLRMGYILKELTEENIKRELQRRDKHNAKTTDIQDIYTMYIDTVGDLLRQFIIDISREDEIIREVQELTAYTNDVIEKIRYRYRCRVPHNIILEIDI